MDRLRVGLIGAGRVSDLHATEHLRNSRAGKHVSLQEPVTRSLREADTAIAARAVWGVYGAWNVGSWCEDVQRRYQAQTL